MIETNQLLKGLPRKLALMALDCGLIVLCYWLAIMLRFDGGDAYKRAATISAIIADEAAIGMVNNKTTAVRIIPVPGKQVGDEVEYGGLLGSAPVMPVHAQSAEAFIARGGRIPAPLQSLRN